MDKKIIVIVILLLIVVGAVIVMMLNTVNYEKIYITPNGTSIDIPANQSKYHNDIYPVKIWSWDNGVLVTYNSHEDRNSIKLAEVGFNTINDLIKKGNPEKIDGFDCYEINADDLLEIHLYDVIKVNYKGKFYCIPLTNGTTHDNIIICCKDRDVALHMAKSVEYKNVFPDDVSLNVGSTINNLTGDLQSKINNYAGNVDLRDIMSALNQKSGDLQSKANDYMNSSQLDDGKSSLEKMAGDLISKNPIKL